jgi:hypothetical protein
VIRLSSGQKESDMQTDRMTKLLLLVIAVGLWTSLLKPVITPPAVVALQSKPAASEPKPAAPEPAVTPVNVMSLGSVNVRVAGRNLPSGRTVAYLEVVDKTGKKSLPLDLGTRDGAQFSNIVLVAKPTTTGGVMAWGIATGSATFQPQPKGPNLAGVLSDLGRQGYEVVGVGDVAGDARPDILLRRRLE